MRKLKFIVSCLFFLAIVFVSGCDKEEIDTFANVSNPNTVLNNGKGANLTVGKVYDYLRQNSDEQISKNIMKLLMEEELKLSTDQDMMNLYKKYLNDKFKEIFVDSDSYNYGGEFSEELVVKYLKSESYNIVCETANDSLLNDAYFTCDYSDYIEKELNYDIYLKMLKVKYIIDEKENMLNKNEGRIINYYSVSRSSSTDVTTRQNLENNIKDIAENYDSEDETLIRSLEDIAESKRNEELKTIDEEFDKISTSSDDQFKYLSKYTTCGDKRCALDEGKLYQQGLIMEKDYYINKVVINSNTDVLFENARKILFGNNLSDYLYEIGDKKYLMSPAYENNGDKNINDIILFDGSSTYYVVEVNVVDENSSFEDKSLIAEMLLDSISESSILDHYFDEVELEIYDKQIREYFVTKYGEY